VQHFDRGHRELPASVRMPNHIFNTDGSIWPGQDSGFLGRAADPWLLRCEPASANYRIPELTLSADVPAVRLTDRQSLLARVSEPLNPVQRGVFLHRSPAAHNRPSTSSPLRKLARRST